MPSRKDKLRAAARERLGRDRSGREPASMSEIVSELEGEQSPNESVSGEAPPSEKEPEEQIPAAEIDLQQQAQEPTIAAESGPRPEPSNTSKENERSMPRTRDSIYNVSSDIRLEDYTESSGGGGQGRLGSIARGLGALILVAIVLYALYYFAGALFGPDYSLAIANEYIDETNIERYAASDTPPALSAARPVYIRFQWEEGQLATDFLTMRVENVSSTPVVEAIQGRRPPVTANYIMFVGPLDAGRYTVEVLDREENVLREREFSVR
ncbi:MAG: hypothetical protein H7A21_03205 [Spirochaetales bacterium]|nr:hypothetical protein [Leptospiraceae bacterium]MCP5480416.1 hypothetical protein [Spirochaetales bacterium]